MGLDMYAYKVNAGILNDTDQVDFQSKLFNDGHAVDGVDTDFAYWRKFNILHGWMERLYVEKGGSAESFNCVPVRLMPEDLDRLERDCMRGDNLTPTAGFFFGGDAPFDVDDRFEIQEFIAKARAAIAEGCAVCYDSWW